MNCQRIMVITILSIMTFVVGCSPSKQGKCKIETRNITITTEPAGATVLQINPKGQPSVNLGVTPVTEQPVVVVTDIIKMKNLSPSESLDMMRRSGGKVSVVINKKGYQQFTGMLETAPDKTLSHKLTLKPVSK